MDNKEDRVSTIWLLCEAELKKDTFDDYLRKQKYAVARDTIAGRSLHCNYCCYCYKHISCMMSIKERIEKALCWKAMNRYLLIKEDLYGTKIRT